jgi:hypothetical protein
MEWLVQLIGHEVIVYQDGSEIEVVRYDHSDEDAMAKAQKVIHDSPLLSDEDKCFAHFWCGYFHALSPR